MADPTIDQGAGTITLDFDSDTNYTLSKAKIGNVHGDGSVILSPQNYTQYAPCEDIATEFNDAGAMVDDTSENPIDGGCGLIDTPSMGDLSFKGGTYGTSNVLRLWCCWFYDEGASSGGEFYMGAHTRNKTPFDAYGIFAFGWDPTAPGTNRYLYKDNPADTGTDTGVIRTKAWHKVVYWAQSTFTIDREYDTQFLGLNGVTEYYAQDQIANPASVSITGATNANPCVITAPGHTFLAGDEIWIESVGGMTEINSRNFTVANPSGNTFELQGEDSTSYGTYTSGGTADAEGGFGTSFKGVGFGSYVNLGGDGTLIDELVLSTNSAVFEEGYAYISAIPTRVFRFLSFSYSADTTGAWLGTVSFECQYTTDGGTNWGTNSPSFNDNNWETMSEANLLAHPCDSDGNDGIRIKTILTPDSTSNFKGVFFPRVKQVVVNFETPPQRTLIGVGR